MALKLYNDSDIQNIASAIRNKNGQSSFYTVSQMADAINAIPSGGGGGGLELVTLEQRQALSVASGSHTNIFFGAFRSCSNLTSVSFPECTSIGSYAFYDCSSLSRVTLSSTVNDVGEYAFFKCGRLNHGYITYGIYSTISIISTGTFGYTGNMSGTFSLCEKIGNDAFTNSFISYISAPVCSSIGGNAFYSCSKLSRAYFPECLYVGPDAFFNCDSLATISFPKCTTIDIRAFGNRNSLVDVSFPQCLSISDYAFRSAGIKTVSFPECTLIRTGAFSTCSKLTSAYFPKCTSIGYSAFYSCKVMKTASFPMCTYISPSAFYSCASLSQLYIGTSRCSLAHSSAFMNTPLSRTGSIYVPSDYVSWYKTATNWTMYSSRIVGY